jgi:1-acyl-sn-glycerol-3-phosphate acyltransferase
MLPPRDAHPVWQLLHLLITLFRPLICRLQVEGRENLPKEGGVVIACNHPGGLDVFVLGYVSPRQIFYMAKQELFEIGWWMNMLLGFAGAFPVRRGQQDVEAVNYSIRLAEEGKILGMFPEGTRNRGLGLRQGRAGVVRIALKANVPIVPAAMTGIMELNRDWRNPFRRPLVTVRFGEPIHLPPGPAKQDALHAYTEQVMYGIAQLLPPEQRGVYGAPNLPPMSEGLDEG